ncbi:MAG: squalene--hopene cyclase [Alphaproteobacteria bacterium]
MGGFLNHGRTAERAPVSEAELWSDAATRASEALLGHVRADGHWAFELEADATIPAEYILLRHFLGESEPALEARIGRYLCSMQTAGGGWPLFHGGDFNVSASVKAYFALKVIGDPVDAPHMARARRAILDHGGAAGCNVFTRIQLALYGEIPWRAVPAMPVEIMLLPRWFPFHLDKVSYWSRAVMVPLLVLLAQRPCARNPKGVNVQELFVRPADRERRWGPPRERTLFGIGFKVLDRLLHAGEPLVPAGPRARAVDRAIDFVLERLNGEDGLGAIYPAMAYTVMMFDGLGDRIDSEDRLTARRAVERLLAQRGDGAYCQPCLSPVWDTALAAHALLEADVAPDTVRRACDWLAERQITDVIGDWAVERPGLAPGGWAFQYANPHYPDLDDTAVVVMALDRCDPGRYADVIARGAAWIAGMQCRNGGWAAFDADNTACYLNHIPFSDHGALLDPPTADVTARCLGMLVQLGWPNDHPRVRAGLDFLAREQERDGSWFGRWGTNYIYGTWSVLAALNAASVEPDAPMVRRAVGWLVRRQRADGGWGEDGRSYYKGQPRGSAAESAPSQTAWALMGLMAAGEVAHPAVARGIAYLERTQNADGEWDEDAFTAVGFPRVFYLRYHGYRAYFPLWALARYRELNASNSGRVRYGV